MTKFTDAEYEAMKQRQQDHYDVDKDGKITFTLEGARVSKPFYEFVGIKISNIKTLSDLERADDIVMASLPEFFAHQRANGGDQFEKDTLEAIMCGSVEDGKKALDRLTTRQKLTVISNKKES